MNPYGQYKDAQGNVLDLKGTLGEQNLAANKIEGASWNPYSAVVTSTAPAEQTTQNMADLTKATTPPPPLTPEQQTAAAKVESDKLLAEAKAKELAQKSAIDGAIGSELGAAMPSQQPKSQAVIDAEAGLASTQTELANLQKTMDTRAATIISNITAEYDAIIKQQEIQNKAYEGGVNIEGSRSGRERYAPVMQAGIISSAISEGLGKISNLQAKKQSLILQAEQARDENNFKALNKSMDAYRDTIKEERKVAQDTYENAIKASQEARAQAKEARDADESAFKTSLTQMDRLAPSIQDAIEGMSEKEAFDYVTAISKDYGFDPNLFVGTINKLGQAQKEKLTTGITSLAKDYPSAGIDPETDTFLSASAKVRNSREYKLDIQKSEISIANMRSSVSARAADAKVNYSDPILTTYANATGQIVSSPSMARAVMGYAENIAGDKEVVDDDFMGPLAENQIKASEYQQLVSSAFAEFKKSPSSTEVQQDINQWLSTADAKAMTTEQKEAKIQFYGGDPMDFTY